MLEMTRSVAQLLFSYLPDRTVSWEDGAGIVKLGTPRLASAWTSASARFVLREVDFYLERWRERGGEIDRRFPPRSSADRFTVGTPQGISASVLSTAYYCRQCFRFVTSQRPGRRLVCPECRRDTMRQIGYVFVHGCGELVPIRDTIPKESTQQPGTIYNAPIRCPSCSNGGILRLDARSERLSALRVVCTQCGAEAVGRPLARCPRCHPRLFGSSGGGGGQLGLRAAMRITRFSANNAYYPHSVTVLRLDRPRTVQGTAEVEWLQGLLPMDDRVTTTGVASSLTELVQQLSEAERVGDRATAEALLRAIAAASQSVSGGELAAERRAGQPVALVADVEQGVHESIALLSAVRRVPVENLGSQDDARRAAVARITGAMGIRSIELVEDLPVVSAVFGYSRRSQDPVYEEDGATSPFPTTLRPFPALDDEAARILGRPLLAGTTPVLAREGLHEGLAVYLDPGALLDWLGVNGITIPGTDLQDRLRVLLGRLEPVARFYDDVDTLPLRRMVFGLLHTLSHCAMRALARTSGLEDTSLSEYLFLPLLGTVIYSTASTELGGVRSTAQERLVEFLENLQEQASRCLYDPDCLHRKGACHGCVHVPEIGCRVFNHGLSRAYLVGGHAPWHLPGEGTSIEGYWRRPRQPGVSS